MYSAPRTQAPCLETRGRNARIFWLIEVGDVLKKPDFLEALGPHFGGHFRPLEPLGAAFWRPGRPSGTISSTMAVQGPKIDDFWVPSGHLLRPILDTF